jgi:hypothetical protein
MPIGWDIAMRAARLWLWWWLLCAFGCASVALDSAQQRDVAYGSEAEQSMDVHAVPGGRAAPVVFMVHGGAWRGVTSAIAMSSSTRLRAGCRAA